MIVLLSILGLCIGSFLNVIVDRLPRNESISRGRSHCENCQHLLSWYDLLPVISFVLLRGRCRYCNKYIGCKYIIIELLTAVSFVLIGWYTNSLGFIISGSQLLELILLLGITTCLLIIFFIDLWHGIIPDSVLVVATIAAFLFLLVAHLSVIPYVLSAIGAGLFFFLLYVFTKGKGMGLGDVKYAIFMGIFLGWPNTFIALYIAFLTGAIVALILVVAKRKKLHGGTIPFGPFLVIGTGISFLFGNMLWQYISIFL